MTTGGTAVGSRVPAPNPAHTRLLVCALLSVLLGTTLLAADQRWIRLQSPNFEVYSTASANATRDALKQFEQLREFFIEALGVKDDRPLPVRIVTFSSPKEYEPYRPNDFADAYYLAGAERDTIVMSRPGSDSFPTVVHEYFHLIANHAGVKAAPWLSEGLAELYSTLRYEANKIRIGDIIPARLQAMRDDRLVPLSVIVAADRESPYYNEKNKAGSLYNEGWALTHMLVMSDAYRPKWPEFFAAIQAGKDSAEALTVTYGKSLDTIERDLNGYVRGNRFSAGVFDLKLAKVGQRFTPDPAPDFDVKLLLLELSRRPGSEDRSREQLSALSAENPTRPEPYTQLGYLAWRTTSSADAEKFFEKAFALGERSTRMLWDYGRMAGRSRPDEGARVLQELLTREPARRDARIELATVQLENNQPKEAIDTLRVTEWHPDEAPRVLSIVAAAEMKRNNREAARSAAERVLTYAPTGEHRQFAQRLLDFLNEPARNAANGPADTTPLDGLARAATAGRPVLLQRDRAAARPSVTGTLVEFLCGESLNFVVQTPSARMTFRLVDPNTLTVVGPPGGQVDLNCGPQKPVAVRLEYDPPAASADRDGIVRVLSFQP
jgi:Tetratricopeptide repeat